MQNKEKRPNILYSCYSQKSSEGEQFIPEHTLTYLISGASEIFIGGEKYAYHDGDFRFFRRKQLARYTKFPPPGGEYKSISIKLDRETLQNISEEYDLHMQKPNNEIWGLELEPNSLLKNYMESILYGVSPSSL